MATPNMALETNALGATDWHTDNEANIAKIDAHDHSSGKGVKVPEAGLATAVVGKLVSNGDTHDHVGGDGAQIDHGGLAGLGDDDHAQYYNQARGDARYAPIAKGVTGGDAHDHAGGDGAQIDHGSLAGLGDDDHAQYYNQARGDARYAPIAKGVTNGDGHDHVGGDGATIGTAGLADGAVTLAKLANDSVDDTKVGARVPQLYRRQGGSATSWSTGGATNYTPGAVRMQAGSRYVSVTETITFPQAFSAHPLIFITFPTGAGYTTSLSIGNDSFTIYVSEGSPIYWLAIGPE